MAGLTAFVGGLLARMEGTTRTEAEDEFVHAIIAFGGGILIAAVAFALVPEGIATLSSVPLAISFCSGGLVIYLLDARISKDGGSKGQFLAMLLDFIPEALALGALFGRSGKSGILLALFIAVQNLPEGFNAYRESVAGQIGPRKTLFILFLMSFLGPIAACAGYLLLREHPVITASMMSAAGGGISTLCFRILLPAQRCIVTDLRL